VITLLGLAGRDPIEVLSYEAPFGVGYGTALWENREETEDNPGSDLPGLARAAILHYLETGKRFPLDEAKTRFSGRDLWERRRACFVSLKNRSDGTLRGCIGTLEPTCASLGEEILQNAVSSATRDPRFEPVTLSELPGITISVDVLASPEKISGPEALDPRRYGVIVEKENRRGVLLPDLEGIDTIEEQLFIASRKAGLPGPNGAALWRFTVDRHPESGRK
jgi:AmmeMemoRadiSam system protein A